MKPGVHIQMVPGGSEEIVVTRELSFLEPRVFVQRTLVLNQIEMAELKKLLTSQ